LTIEQKFLARLSLLPNEIRPLIFAPLSLSHTTTPPIHLPEVGLWRSLPELLCCCVALVSAEVVSGGSVVVWAAVVVCCLLCEADEVVVCSFEAVVVVCDVLSEEAAVVVVSLSLSELSEADVVVVVVVSLCDVSCSDELVSEADEASLSEAEVCVTDVVSSDFFSSELSVVFPQPETSSEAAIARASTAFFLFFITKHPFIY
jgi:hypothetical protein